MLQSKKLQVRISPMGMGARFCQVTFSQEWPMELYPILNRAIYLFSLRGGYLRGLCIGVRDCTL